METTVNISENAFRYISSIAHLTERTIDEVLEETFEDRLEEEAGLLNKSIEISSDEEVLMLAGFQMPERQSNRLSRLIAKNGEGTLSSKEKEELANLMVVNRFNDLRKAMGIVEAIKRGLIESVKELA